MATGILINALVADTAPAPVRADVSYLTSKYSNVADPRCKILQVAVSPSLRKLDYRDFLEMEDSASVRMSIDMVMGYVYYRRLLFRCANSKWEESKIGGNPRFGMAFEEEGLARRLVFLIDQKNNLVMAGGKWYRVNKELIEYMTVDFQKFLVRHINSTPAEADAWREELEELYKEIEGGSGGGRA